MDPTTALAVDGPLLLASGVALLAGVISFASPCVVPLVPGYLAYLAALVGADAPPVKVTARGLPAPPRSEPPEPGAGGSWARSGCSCSGSPWSSPPTSAAWCWLADALLINEDLLQRIGGVIIDRDGAGVHRARSRAAARVPLPPRARGSAWPARRCSARSSGSAGRRASARRCPACTILASSTGGTAARGLLLVLVYCLGLGLPFLVIALGARWAVRASGWLRRHGRTIQLTGGGLLFVVGVLLVTGLWGELTSWLRDAVSPTRCCRCDRVSCATPGAA